MHPGDRKKAPDNTHESVDQQTKEEKIEQALAEFSLAWCGEECLDPVAFCAEHVDCGPALRERIDDFLYVAHTTDPHGGSREDPGQGDIETVLAAGKTLGDYKIVREIGRGGMGVVYEAEQLSLNRRVALKVLPPHLSWSQEAVLKFRREAEAGSRQIHPHLVAVYAVGEHEGIHYIAQELVEGGGSLADRLKTLREKAEPPAGYFRDVAKLCTKIARALLHAHTAGVIHRDIKPSNILLTLDGQPKVSDFGLARVEDALALSRSGSLAGTPYYMSPEQAGSRRSAIDHRTDIYSLGVTLYEMLTETVPFEGKTSHEVLKKILTMEPRNPQQIKSHVPRDLAVICLKAMEKVPAHRYATMGDFADDLTRFIEGRPIMAQPAGAVTRAFKRIRRNPAFSAAAGVAAIAVLVVLIVIPILYVQTIEYVKELETQKALTWFANAMKDAKSNPARALALILEAINRIDREKADPKVVSTSDDVLAEVLNNCYEEKEISAAHVTYVAMSPRHTKVVTAPENGTPQVLDAATGSCLLELKGHTKKVNTAAFDRKGARIVTASEDYTARVWDLETGGCIAEFKHTNAVNSAVFNFDGTRVLTASDDMTIAIWDVQREKRIHRFFGHTEAVLSATYHPNGKEILSFSEDGTVRIRTLEDGRSRIIDRFDKPPLCAEFNYDGSLIMTLTASGRLQIREYEALDEILPIFTSKKYGFAAFSHKDNRLLTVTNNNDPTISFCELCRDSDLAAPLRWNTLSETDLKGHQAPILMAAFSNDAERIVSISEDHKIKIWTTRIEGPLSEPVTYEGIAPKKYSEDGSRAATMTYTPEGDFRIKVWDTEKDTLIKQFHIERDCFTDLCRGMRFSHKGDWLAFVTSAGNERIYLCPIDSETDTEPLPIHEDSDQNPGDIRGLDFSKDDSNIVVPYGEKCAVVYNIATGLVEHILPHEEGVSKALYNYPIGNRIATFSEVQRIRLWDAETGEEIPCSFEDAGKEYTDIRFSPDGTKLVTVAAGLCRIWDCTTGNELPSCRNLDITEVIFDENRDRSAIFLRDGKAYLSDERLEKRIPCEGEIHKILGAAFSADGKKMIALMEMDNASSMICHWETPSGKRVDFRRLDRSLGTKLKISEDSRWAMVISKSREKPYVWPLIDLEPFASSGKPRDLTLQELRDSGLLSKREIAIMDYIRDRFDNPPDARMTCEEIVKALRMDDDIPESAHHWIDLYHELFRKDPWKLYESAWEAVRLPLDESESTRALAFAREACKLEPDNKSFQQTLGMAQYRSGLFHEAIETLSPFLDETEPCSTHADRAGGYMVPIVFTAMAYHRLGDTQKAKSRLDAFHAMIRDPRNSRFPEYMGFLAEADQLILSPLLAERPPNAPPDSWRRIKEELEYIVLSTFNKKYGRLQLYDPSGFGKAMTLIDYRFRGPDYLDFSFHPDGTRLCTIENCDRYARIFTFNMNDDLTLSDKKCIYKEDRLQIADSCWNPEFDIIYFVKNENRQGDVIRELCLIDLLKDADEKPSLIFGPSSKYIASLHCSSDGGELLFCASTEINEYTTRELFHATLHDGGEALYEPSRLTTNYLPDVNPRYACEDKYIFWQVEERSIENPHGKTSSIFRMNRDGTGQIRYHQFFPPGDNRAFAVSSSGILAYADSDENLTSLLLVNPDGEILTRLSAEKLGIEAPIAQIEFIKRK